jgi:hypothetical protein
MSPEVALHWQNARSPMYLCQKLAVTGRHVVEIRRLSTPKNSPCGMER